MATITGISVSGSGEIDGHGDSSTMEILPFHVWIG